MSQQKEQLENQIKELDTKRKALKDQYKAVLAVERERKREEEKLALYIGMVLVEKNPQEAAKYREAAMAKMQEHKARVEKAKAASAAKRAAKGTRKGKTKATQQELIK